MVIMQGDSCAVYIELKQKDRLLTPELLDDVEVCIGGSRLRKTLEDGSVAWNGEQGKWSLRLSQEDTFAMRDGRHPVIVRVKYKNTPDFDVRGVTVGSITVTSTYSREVL